jgi:hypothetical protein
MKVLDHRVAHKGDVQLFLDVNNFQAVHKRCHDGVKSRFERATARGEYREEVATGADGYPLEVVASGGKALARGTATSLGLIPNNSGRGGSGEIIASDFQHRMPATEKVQPCLQRRPEPAPWALQSHQEPSK